jgi:hypothetical protein
MDKKVHLREMDFFVHLENVCRNFSDSHIGAVHLGERDFFVHLGEMDLAVKMDPIFAT